MMMTTKTSICQKYCMLTLENLIDKATILTEHFNTMYNAGVCTCILPAYTHRYMIM